MRFDPVAEDVLSTPVGRSKGSAMFSQNAHVMSKFCVSSITNQADFLYQQ